MSISTVPVDLTNGDYRLVDKTVWLEVKGFAIWVRATDEGVVVDIYKSGEEDGDSLASCYSFDSELLDEEGA